MHDPLCITAEYGEYYRNYKEESCQFVHIIMFWGVSREATLEEITNAKNALAKVYHPDANMHNDIDTTAYMQEILEAYRTLSDPEKRRQYDLELGGGKKRVFRTFTVGDPGREKKKAEKKESDSFVTYWNAACKLNEYSSVKKMLPSGRTGIQTRQPADESIAKNRKDRSGGTGNRRTTQ